MGKVLGFPNFNNDVVSYLKNENTAQRTYTFPDRDIIIAGKDDLVTGVEVWVSTFGAVGDGVTDDTVAIISAITTAGIGGIIRFVNNKTYIISGTLTPLDGQKFIGMNSTIKRINASTTTLTSSYTPGGTSIVVTSVSSFSVGQVIALFDATGTYSGEGYNESSATSDTGGIGTITSIVGNTINFTGSFPLPGSGNLNGGGVWPSGSKVANVFTSIRINNTSNYSNIIFDGLIFDGNKANNTQTCDWRLMKNMDFGVIKGGVIRNCLFKNMPSENVFINANSLIDNCFFEDTNGSGIHNSSNITTGFNKITRCRFSNTNIKGNAKMNHSEGAITLSANSVKMVIEKCLFENSTLGAVISPISGDDSILIFNDNQCYNMNGIFSASSYAALPNYVLFHHNIFDNCKSFEMTIASTGSVQKGFGWDQFTITNNVFKNILVEFNNVTNGKVDNNTFVTSTGFTYSGALLSGTVSKSSLLVRGGGNLRITNNQFYHDQTLDSNLNDAILINNTNGGTNGIYQPIYKSGASTTTYTYFQDVICADNIISGYPKGITETHSQAIEAINFVIADNIINVLNLSGAVYGIYAAPGTVVKGNTINTNSFCTSGIDLDGATDATATAINGPICHGNFIYGNATNSIRMATSSLYRNNIMCNYNYITGAILNTQSAFNPTPTGNVTMPLPAKARPANDYRTNTANY